MIWPSFSSATEEIELPEEQPSQSEELEEPEEIIEPTTTEDNQTSSEEQFPEPPLE